MQKLTRYISIVVTMISMAAGVMVATITFKSVSERDRVAVSKSTNQLSQVVAETEKRDEEQIKQLTSKVARLSKIVDNATKNPQALEAAKTAAQLTQLSKEIKTIENALGSDLERSLSVPLFRKDLAQLKEQVNSRTFVAQKEIDRMYDQNKWFLGLMGTMALGLVGLAVSNFLQSRKEKS